MISTFIYNVYYFSKKITQHIQVSDQLTSPLKSNTHATIGLTTLGA